MAKPLYIGSFPPPYGGVTVKNALLFESLSEKVPLEKLNLVDAKKGNMQAVCMLAKALLAREGSLAIGISPQSYLQVTRFMHRVNRGKMGRSILFVMGGRVPENEADVLKLGCYRRVYVETESMKDRFETMGAKNVSVYPNCRKRPVAPCSVRPSIDGKVKCVYFSLISEQKGARLVLDVARNSPEMEFHFYGRIDQAFEAHFMSEVSDLANVQYHGVFDSASGDVVAELNAYDIHLFPTMCPNEGVPGVIVETKIAAVPTVASGRGYNGELVEDGVDGLLTREDSADELSGIVKALAKDPRRLDCMKKAALASAERFYIDSYLEPICSELLRGRQAEDS